MTTFFDDFSGYAVGNTPQGTWIGNLPAVQAVGRNGGRGVYKSPTQWLRRDSGPYVWAVLKVEDAGGYVSFSNAQVGQPADTATMRTMLIGVGQGRHCHGGVAISADGTLHLLRGCAFAETLNNQRWSPMFECDTLASCVSELTDMPSVVVLDSSAPGAFPIGRGWAVLELFLQPGFGELCTNGRAFVRVNGQTVISFVGGISSFAARTEACFPVGITARYLYDDVGGPQVEWMGMGGGSVGTVRGGEAIGGWSGYIAAVGSFDATDDYGETGPIGDLQVDTLLAAAESGTPISTITGTAPAGSRVASIGDFGTATEDNSTITFADTDAPGGDEYTTAGLSISSGALVPAVQVSARGSASVPGFVVPRFGASNGTGAEDVTGALFRGATPRYMAAAIPRPGGGAWTAADVASLNLRIGRQQ